jgi:hypothetical protein
VVQCCQRHVALHQRLRLVRAAVGYRDASRKRLDEWPQYTGSGTARADQ